MSKLKEENQNKPYDGLLWYKERIEQMSWDEIQDLMSERIQNGSWDKFIETLGKAPHVIKHDYLLREMNQMNQMSMSDELDEVKDIAKLLGHMDDDGNYIK